MVKMEIRKLSIKDDFEQVGELIYLTDPYIYPYWFQNNIDEAKKMFNILIRKNTIFNYKNCIVAIENKKIIGLILSVAKENKITDKLESLKKISFNYRYVIEKYISKIYKLYKKDTIYIMCVCVLPEFRNHKVASKMMDFFIKKFKNREFLLDVLVDNTFAKKLYKNFGFVKIKRTLGFSGYGFPKVKVDVMTRRYNNL